MRTDSESKSSKKETHCDQKWIKLLGACLIIFFGLGAFMTCACFFLPADIAGMFNITTLDLIIASLLNLGFVIGGIGVLRIRSWGLWFTVALCAASIVDIFIKIFTKLTPETATGEAKLATYFVAGFYLGIAFFLTSERSRKLFRIEKRKTDKKIASDNSGPTSNFSKD